MKRVMLVMGCLLVMSHARAEEPETLPIGARAPAFELTGIDGKDYSLESFSQAEVLMVVFTANHCPTAQAYEERLKELAAGYPQAQFQLVAISSNHPGAVCLEELGYSDLGDSFEEMKVRAAERAYNFPYLYDGDHQIVAMAYGAKATPHVFIFDRDRILRYTGRIDDMEDPYQEPSSRDAQSAIEALLAGKPVPVASTRAFGCSMKWKAKTEWRRKLDQEWAEKPVELATLDEGGVKTLAGNPGENLRLINFWATWCGPCIIEFPEIVNMQRIYGQRGFEVVSVSMDQPSKRDKVLQFLKENHAAFANYLAVPADRDAMIEAVYPGWQGNLPFTLVVAPGGEVVLAHDGIIDPLEVRKAIVEHLGRYYAND